MHSSLFCTALEGAARLVDETWDQMAEAEDANDEFDRFAQAIGNMRRVLDGTRTYHIDLRGRRHVPRCGCGWTGSGPLNTPAERVAAFTAHICNEVTQ